MAGGRPSHYTPELLAKCYEYLDSYEDEGDVIPSHSGMFLYTGISKTCGYDWAKDEGKEEFADILDRCKLMQHQVLINKGLANEFNSNITKLVLGKHGYHDKQDLETKGSLTVVIPDKDADTL